MSPRSTLFIALAAIGIGIGFRLGRQSPDTEIVDGKAPQGNQVEPQPSAPAANSLTAIKQPPPDGSKPQIESNEERLAKLSELKKLDDYMARYQVLGPLFRSWARSDPDAAFDAWIETPEVAGMGFSYGMIAQLHQANGFEATLRRIREIQDPKSRHEAQRQLGGELHAAGDPQAAAELLLEELPEAERAEPMGSAILTWRLKADIDTVWNWVESKREHFDASSIAQLERSAAQGLIRSNPEKAIEWLMARATDESRSLHLASIAGTWAREEPNAAAKWLGTLPPGPQNDEALATFARQIAADDPESAAHWASTITSPSERKQCLNHITAHWRVTDPAAAAKFERDQ